MASVVSARSTAAGSGVSAAKHNAAAQPHSSNTRLGMEDIFEALMRGAEKGNGLTGTLSANAAPPSPNNNNGPSSLSAVTLAQSIDVWSAACQMAEEAILKRQSLVITDFASVGVRKETEGMGGIWRDRLSFVPCFNLLPNFVSQYCSDRAGYHVANGQKYGGAVPILMNGATLSSYANVPRHTAVNVLKDVVRIIGKFLLEGHPTTGKKVPLTVEMGFVTLEFTAVSLQTKWSRRFLDEMAAVLKQADADGTLGNVTGSTSPRRPRTANAAMNSTNGGANNEPQQRIPAPPRAGLALNPNAIAGGRAVPAPPTPTAPSPSAGRGGRKVIVQQPSSRPSSAARGAMPFNNNTSSNGPAAGYSPSPSRSNSVCSNRSTSSSCRGPATPSRQQQQQQHYGAPPNFNASNAFNNSSPRNREQFFASLDAITKSTANPYLKTKARKAAYRRMRGNAFEDSWDTQIQLQREKEDRDREEERTRVEHFRRSLAEQAAKEHNDRLGRRWEERQVQEINKALAAKRDEFQLPKKVDEPGDLFNSRNPPQRRDGNERQILLHQMAEKKEREAKERAADKVYHQHVVQQDAEWNATLAADKAHKQQQQRQLMADYEKQLALKAAEEARYKATMPKAGCILYSEDDSAADERRERNAVKHRTREYQQENKRFAEEKEHLGRIASAEKDLYNKTYRKAQDALARQKAEEDRTVLRSRQDALGDVLKRQMEERRRAEAKEKHERDTWRDFTYLRNESSDDEM